MSIFDYLKEKLHGEPPLNPVERGMAKRWVKERLKHIFPELRNDPKRLEEAYQSLTIEPRPGTGKGGETMFEIIVPGKLK